MTSTATYPKIVSLLNNGIIYTAKNTIDRWFEFFEKEWINFESVKRFSVEPHTLHQQVLRLNELSFEIEARHNPEFVNK